MHPYIHSEIHNENHQLPEDEKNVLSLLTCLEAAVLQRFRLLEKHRKYLQKKVQENNNRNEHRC